ncbi:MAG: proton-conducting transporter membrane subunit [Methylococcaceae bacterium]
MDAIAPLIPLLPLIAAIIIGIGHFVGLIHGEASEKITARIATSAISVSFFIALTLIATDGLGKTSGIYALQGTFTAGQWLAIGNFSIPINFINGSFNIRLVCLFALLLFIVMRFSVNYMHRESGFHRFFFILNLFAAAMLWLVLAGNAIGTFVGWELAGLCSYLLIAYFHERPMAVANATRVFITNRIGDAGFILGIGLSYTWLDSTQWYDITVAAEHLTAGKANALALCFALAAFVKSAQLPFTPWLARAMEGPTPSSAVFYGAIMIHAGVYLVCLLQPLFEHAPMVMILMAGIGLITALYSFFVGLTQTDVKSSLIFATSGQVGLMFLECGLGYWQLASWHLCAHAIVRGYQFLTAPSLMHNIQNNPIKSVNPALAKLPWAYIASIQRMWLEPLTDWVVIKPVRGLAHDLSHFDEHIVNRMMGVAAPSIQTMSSLAQRKEYSLGARLDNEADEFAQGSGLAGKLTEWSATLVDWFEDRFVLRNHDKASGHFGRQLGHAAHKFEQFILRPRWLVLFVFILLLTAF